MAEILSPDELDALLAQMKEGESEADDDSADLAGVSQPPTAAHAPSQTGPDDGQTGDAGRSNNLDVLLALPVDVRVEIGRAKVAVVDLLNLCQGSVIELNNLASEMIELTMNDKVVAQGEAVVINENFGIRILEVDSVRDRILKL